MFFKLIIQAKIFDSKYLNFRYEYLCRNDANFEQAQHADQGLEWDCLAKKSGE